MNRMDEAANPATALMKAALAVAMTAADAAGTVLKKHFGRLKTVDEKFQAGLVSEADRESESVIKAVIRKRFPEHAILGEETGLSTGLPPKAGPSGLWLIDPLDGTTNYVHRIPFFCSSLGFEIDGQLAVGVVDAPLLGARYHAVAGSGAFLNGQPIHVSSRTAFRDGLFATGFSGSDQTLPAQLELLAQVIRQTRGVRRLGAAALDLCLVAEGVFDGFWEKNLQPWDTAAGVLIAREAGAKATDFEGTEFNPRLSSVLCAAPDQHRSVLTILQPLYRSHRSSQ